MPYATNKNRSTKAYRQYEKWLGDALDDMCQDNGWSCEAQVTERDSRGHMHRPDFVIYSRSGSACVIIDAKNYHKSNVPVEEIRKLAGDVRLFDAYTGILVCAHRGLSSKAEDEMEKHGFYVVETEGLEVDAVCAAIASIVNDEFYGGSSSGSGESGSGGSGSGSDEE